MATAAGDDLTLSYVLGTSASESRPPVALTPRELLTESTRLRRDLDFTPGVAAN
ncbi:hypothetical protein ABZU25_04345 [Micromonospora sp. NPDC005215]|uniref:hypothetical protein n=1 Tax=Micromonospora sp. NPDC005215 TaxID=3157024 RepID=UPI0033A92A22